MKSSISLTELRKLSNIFCVVWKIVQLLTLINRCTILHYTSILYTQYARDPIRHVTCQASLLPMSCIYLCAVCTLYYCIACVQCMHCRIGLALSRSFAIMLRARSSSMCASYVSEDRRL